MISVYWIRHKDHTDIFSQGYVGISNKPKERWRHHCTKPSNLHMKNAIAKYGWDNLVKEVILISDKEYCLDIEKKLRPTDFIGWNATLGGGFPPKAKKGMAKAGNYQTQQRQRLPKQERKGYGQMKHEKKSDKHLWRNGRSIVPMEINTPEPADEVTQ